MMQTGISLPSNDDDGNFLSNVNPNPAMYSWWQSFIQFTIVCCLFAIFLLLICWLLSHFFEGDLVFLAESYNWSTWFRFIFYFNIIPLAISLILYYYFFDFFSFMTATVFRYFSPFSFHYYTNVPFFNYLCNLDNTLSDYIYELDSKHYRFFQYYYPLHSDYLWGLSIWLRAKSLGFILREYIFYFIGGYIHFSCVILRNFLEFFVNDVLIDFMGLEWLSTFPMATEKLEYTMCFIFSLYIFYRLVIRLGSLTCPYTPEKCQFSANFIIKRGLFCCFLVCFLLCNNIIYIWHFSLFVFIMYYSLVRILYQLDIYTYAQFHKIRCILSLGIGISFVCTHTSISLINMTVITFGSLVHKPVFMTLKGGMGLPGDYLFYNFSIIVCLFLFLMILKNMMYWEWSKVKHVQVNHLKITQVMYVLFGIYILKFLYLLSCILMVMYEDPYTFFGYIVFSIIVFYFFYFFWKSDRYNNVFLIYKEADIAWFFEKNKQKLKPYSNYTIVFIIIFLLIFCYIGIAPFL